MSSTIFNDRLQDLKASGKYPKTVLEQIEKVASENGGKPPKCFFMKDVGRNTLSNILYDLGISYFDIEAPNGSKSSERKISL